MFDYDYIKSYLTRSLLFVAIDQVIAVIIRIWQMCGYMSTCNLFKLELVMYIVLNLWLMGFTSLSDLESYDCASACGQEISTAYRREDRDNGDSPALT